MNRALLEPARALDLVLSRRVIVCCGSGGVGKTTLSAALGIAAARAGKRVLVCTIDPAKRLANALGIRELGNEAYLVSAERLAEADLTLAPGGSFSAMMLDTKRTFDRLIERHAPSPEVAQRILKNHVYRQFSSQLAGSQEYMAMEKLYELHHDGRYDLIVLDTPPTKHALDFLHAPRRLSTFLEASVLKWFLMPLRGGGGLAGKVAQKVLGLLDTVFGTKVIEDLAEFFAAFEDLWGGFKERAERVNALLRDERTAGFFVVMSATRETASEARFFHEQLRLHGLPVLGFLANRVHRSFAAGIEPGPLRDALSSSGGRGSDVLPAGAAEALGADAATIERAIRDFLDLERLAAADREQLRETAERARREGLHFTEIPAFDRDVYDLTGLRDLQPYLARHEPVHGDQPGAPNGAVP